MLWANDISRDLSLWCAYVTVERILVCLTYDKYGIIQMISFENMRFKYLSVICLRIRLWKIQLTTSGIPTLDLYVWSPSWSVVYKLVTNKKIRPYQQPNPCASITVLFYSYVMIWFDVFYPLQLTIIFVKLQGKCSVTISNSISVHNVCSAMCLIATSNFETI